MYAISEQSSIRIIEPNQEPVSKVCCVAKERIPQSLKSFRDANKFSIDGLAALL
jgi:hypothetical protein